MVGCAKDPREVAEKVKLSVAKYRYIHSVNFYKTKGSDVFENLSAGP